MSINALGATTPWWAAQASGASAVTSDAAAATSSTSATNATGLGNFFQQFAADLQSMLTQAQATTGGATTTTASGTTASGTTNPATAPPPDTTTQDATTSTATEQTATQQPGAVHHHHHHGGGDGGGGGPLQNAANQFVGQVAQVFGGGSGNAAPATGTTASGANTLATDIVQALQNYGAFASNPAASTVSTTA
jgi:hypothetical protein